MTRNPRTLLDRRVEGERLTRDELLDLYTKADLLDLGQAAHAVRTRLHDPDRVTFVKDLNLNYTNVCVVKCKFCAFYRDPDAEDIYVRDPAEILAKVEQLTRLGGTQVLIQGGLHPDLEWDYYLDLLSEIKRRYPVDVHSFTATEIDFFARLYKMDHAQVLRELRDAGLDSLPGGGAEVLTDRVREEISPLKNTADTWLSIHRTAHGLGLPSTATMMYGSTDTASDRIDHLMKVRALQDETGGFSAFIPWSFQPDHTPLADERPDLVPDNTAFDYLRMVAIARLALDNVPHLQAGWVTEGKKIGQTALSFGCDDWGGILMEENVVREAGATFRTTVEESLRYIREAGYTPVQRNTYYLPLREYADDYEVEQEARRSTPIMETLELPVVS